MAGTMYTSAESGSMYLPFSLCTRVQRVGVCTFPSVYVHECREWEYVPSLQSMYTSTESGSMYLPWVHSLLVHAPLPAGPEGAGGGGGGGGAHSINISMTTNVDIHAVYR